MLHNDEHNQTPVLCEEYIEQEQEDNQQAVTLLILFASNGYFIPVESN